MKNREYINRLLEELGNNLRNCQRLVQTQEPVHVYREALQKCIEISEQIEGVVENEPRDGYEQNPALNR
jgi:5-bromo-4-chloroindolyl phosphate hydrolysis protein